MVKVIEIKEDSLKIKIAEDTLRNLPEWFGLEESLLEYINSVSDKTFYAAYVGEKAVGFTCLKVNNQYTADVYVMGVLKEFHNKGVGKKLIYEAEKFLLNQRYKFLMVKTLGSSSDDEGYRKTRQFYQRVGFYPLEEFREIWDENNPCLIMIKCLEKS